MIDNLVTHYHSLQYFGAQRSYAKTLGFVFVRYLISQHLLITEQEPLSLLSHGIGALLNVGLNLWLIPTMGIVGAAWATLISYAYASFFFLFFARSTRSQLWQLFKASAKTGTQ